MRTQYLCSVWKEEGAVQNKANETPEEGDVGTKKEATGKMPEEDTLSLQNARGRKFSY